MSEKTKTVRRGFTLIEVILIISFFSLLVVLGLIYYRSTQLRIDMNTQVEKFVAEVRLAQTNALAGVGGSDHGVHLESSFYTIFVGSSYVPADSQNYQIDLPATFEIQNIALNGGGSDVIFDSVNGETTNFGSLDFVSNQLNKTISVSISRFGVINY